MNCQICKDFAVLQAVVAGMKAQVPGLGWTINASLVWHLSVVHGLSYLDLGTVRLESTDTATAAGPVPPNPEDGPSAL